MTFDAFETQRQLGRQELKNWLVAHEDEWPGMSGTVETAALAALIQQRAERDVARKALRELLEFIDDGADLKVKTTIYFENESEMRGIMVRLREAAGLKETT